MPALTTKTCRECRSEIDKRASICPHCRSKQPGPPFGLIAVAAIIFLASVGAFKGQSSSSLADNSNNAVSTKETDKPKAVAPPLVGAHMTTEYFDYVKKEARFECEAALNKRATYGVRVSDTLLFGIRAPLNPTRINKYQLASGHVTFWGDDIEAQTEFGQWIPANYECEWNPSNKRVVNARITLGKLPQSFGRD